MLKTVTDINEMIVMSNIINERFGVDYNLKNMTINFKVDDLTLKQINETLYNKNNNNGSPEDTDEIIVKINGITFIYNTI